MKKAFIIALLMFFAHSIFLFLLLANMNRSISEQSTTPDNGIYSFIAFFCTLIIYFFTVILIIIEKLMKYNCKTIILLLAFINCIIEFYFNSITQYHLFTSPERFNNTAVIIIVIYFFFELGLTFFAIKKLYVHKKF